MRKRNLYLRVFGAAMWLILVAAALLFLLRWRSRQPIADQDGRR
jgi:hypothetical protein